MATRQHGAIEPTAGLPPRVIAVMPARGDGARLRAKQQRLPTALSFHCRADASNAAEAAMSPENDYFMPASLSGRGDDAAQLESDGR